MCNPPEVYSETPRRARKDHTCCECGKEIMQGETYIDISGLWEGEWDSFKMCDACNLLLHSATKKYAGPGIPPPNMGELFAWIKERNR